jgi:hypothetical protein
MVAMVWALSDRRLGRMKPNLANDIEFRKNSINSSPFFGFVQYFFDSQQFIKTQGNGQIPKLISELKRAYFLGKARKLASFKRQKVFFHTHSTCFVE